MSVYVLTCQGGAQWATRSPNEWDGERVLHQEKLDMRTREAKDRVEYLEDMGQSDL